MTDKGKLRIWHVIAWGYQHTLRNMGTVIKVGALSISASLIYISIVSPVLIYPNANEFTDFASKVFVSFIGSHFAVGWHRSILLGETSSLFRFRTFEFRYFAVIMSFNLVELGMDYIPALQGVAGDISAVLLGIVCVFVLVFLPASAIGDRSMTISKFWHGLEGNRWRLFWTIIISVSCYLLMLELVKYAALEVHPYIKDTFGVYDGSGDLKTIASALVGEFIFASIFVCGMFPLLACSLSTISVIYAGIVKQVAHYDPNYSPITEFRD